MKDEWENIEGGLPIEQDHDVWKQQQQQQHQQQQHQQPKQPKQTERHYLFLENIIFHRLKTEVTTAMIAAPIRTPQAVLTRTDADLKHALSFLTHDHNHNHDYNYNYNSNLNTRHENDTSYYSNEEVTPAELRRHVALSLLFQRKRKLKRKREQQEQEQQQEQSRRQAVSQKKLPLHSSDVGNNAEHSFVEYKDPLAILTPSVWDLMHPPRRNTQEQSPTSHRCLLPEHRHNNRTSYSSSFSLSTGCPNLDELICFPPEWRRHIDKEQKMMIAKEPSTTTTATATATATIGREDLNDCTGLVSGYVYQIEGASGSGKTQLALQIAMEATTTTTTTANTVFTGNTADATGICPSRKSYKNDKNDIVRYCASTSGASLHDLAIRSQQLLLLGTQSSSSSSSSVKRQKKGHDVPNTKRSENQTQNQNQYNLPSNLQFQSISDPHELTLLWNTFLDQHQNQNLDCDCNCDCTNPTIVDNELEGHQKRGQHQLPVAATPKVLIIDSLSTILQGMGGGSVNGGNKNGETTISSNNNDGGDGGGGSTTTTTSFSARSGEMASYASVASMSSMWIRRLRNLARQQNMIVIVITGRTTTSTIVGGKGNSGVGVSVSNHDADVVLHLQKQEQSSMSLSSTSSTYATNTTTTTPTTTIATSHHHLPISPIKQIPTVKATLQYHIGKIVPYTT